MGAMGRYIAGLSEEGRDRLIGATRWGHANAPYGRFGVKPYHAVRPGESYPADGGCLVDNATGRHAAFVEEHSKPLHVNAALPFDKAGGRFGLARVVRAVKLRASKLNGTDPRSIGYLLEERAERVVGA